MEDSFNSIIDSANSILILLPSKPYFDQVAAGLALHLSLGDKKEVAISCPSQMVVEFNRLVGVNKIAQELGNKNLVIKFAGYQAGNIERVSYDIENSEFRLTVIPKPGMPSPKKEQANLSYSGVSADTIILIGGANESHFPALASNNLVGAKFVHIGIRALSVSPEKGIMSFARPASSVSEVIASLIKEIGLNLDMDIATNLLMGIEEGSNKFSSPEVSAETFQTVSDLMKAGGKRVRKTPLQKGAFPPGSIPGRVPQVQPPSAKAPEGEGKEETPKSWLEPKIYKGTSIS